MVDDIQFWEKEVREWGEKSWSPVTGCDPISIGCEHCWARDEAYKKAGTNGYPAEDPFRIIIHDGNNPDLNLQNDSNRFLRKESPASVGYPLRYFTDSMGDLFHKDVPFGAIERAFGVMEGANQHIFLVCTKRAQRLHEIAFDLPWPEHIVAAVTVESNAYLDRIEHLKQIPAATKILFMEPLMSSMPKLDLDDIDQVVVGGESGEGARPMEEEWVRGLRDQCLSQGVCFYFKQWGAHQRRRKGCVLDGETWGQWPEWIQEWNAARGYTYAFKKKKKWIYI